MRSVLNRHRADTGSETRQDFRRHQPWPKVLATLGCLQAIGYLFIAWLGDQYAYEIPDSRRPILLVTGTYMVLSLISLVASWMAVGTVKTGLQPKRMVQVVLAFAILFRAVQLIPPPFQEVDLYRYIWDGKVTVSGISPYKYSPAEFKFTEPSSTQTILSRVHFAQYTTPYPPVSQAVFAAAMFSVPDSASVRTHLLTIRTVMSLFDLATLLLVMRLLNLLGMPIGLSVLYGWNPLVIKEIAGSGHLDSIAVFFTVASLYALTRLVQANEPPFKLVCCAAGLLALGFGAKLFPIIVCPLIAWFVFRRIGAKASLAFMLTFSIVAATVTAPMFLSRLDALHHETVDVPPSIVPKTKAGLTSFLTQWRMNDLAFSLIYENLPGDPSRAFIITRGITLVAWLILCGWVAWRNEHRSSNPDQACRQLLESAFLVVAAFFFLLPTQNPWYWTWALPVMCFVRNRGWWIISPMLFLYYTRFWFDQAGRVEIFDQYIVWIEHGVPLLCVVAINRMRR